MSQPAGPDIQERVQELEYGAREYRGSLRYLAGGIAVAMSLFQLYTAGIRPFPASIQRSIHLTFVLGLCFLYYPLGRRSPRRRLPWYDAVLGLVAAGSAAYTFLYYEQLVKRVGSPNTVDLIFAGLAVLAVLEVARRVIGPALPLIAIAFILYAVLGPYMPDLLLHRGYGIRRILDQLYMSLEGVYGIPIGVSSTFVFAFVLYGAVLERLGAGEYFINLAFSLLGHYRGGPAKVAVVSSGMFGMISGSSIANVVTTGTFTIPLMKRVGFSPEVAGAVESSASTHGQLMPPVMGAAAFIMAEMLGIPYLEIAKAAFIPALISYIGLFCVVHLEAVKTGIHGIPRQELPRFWPTFTGGLHHLLSVAVLIYYLLVELASPQRAAFYATGVALLTHVVRRLWEAGRAPRAPGRFLARYGQGAWTALRQATGAFEAAARNIVGIAAACACAGIIIGVTALTGLGLRMTELILTLAFGNFHLTLVMTMVASIILGMGVPTTATYIMMATLTAPAIREINPLVPILAAHLFVFYFGIVADDTPPVAVAAYAAAGLAGGDPFRTGLQAFKFELRTFLLPFMFVYSPQMLLINTTPLEVVWLTLTASLGIYAFSACIQRQFILGTTWLEGLLLLAAALLLITPGLTTDLVGFAVFGLTYWLQHQRRRRLGPVPVSVPASVPGGG